MPGERRESGRTKKGNKLYTVKIVVISKTKTWPQELWIAAAELMRWKISQGKEPSIDKGRKTAWKGEITKWEKRKVLKPPSARWKSKTKEWIN